jgi:hypothetical protein
MKMSIREFPVSNFAAISARWPMDIRIQQSDTCSITITGQDAQLDNINLSVDGERLNLSLRMNLVTCLVAPFSKMSAVISLPFLRELVLSGASNCKIGRFKSTEDFKLKVDGASRLEFTDFSCGQLSFDLSGASHIKGLIEGAGSLDLKVNGASKLDLNGSAGNLIVEASGASNLDLVDFVVQNARIKLSGASRGSLNLNGKMDVALEGASRLDYSGQVVLGETRISGSSTINRK